ncbi:MAG: hypothetical protein AVDCRST_MAG85-5 [uncultured Solirubrobacteraceae bacterium]|uniref:MEDS domain-containing protein n=1 Tax=uncultured Solirubrobacteraceae bacterium TaxID=1162706 RepID=A0A6J4REJ7_9ACTN|nr:MAG: hypothetical protein AVDCRST_MAG85-5 [uncultured Solirubrobacteraceae bacterium]
MPVYECARCNNLTYSASRFGSIQCDQCGGTRHRSLEHAYSFDEARDEPRKLSDGDHCCLGFDDPVDVAQICAHVIGTGLAAGARVIAHPPADVRAAIEPLLEPHEAGAVEWTDSDLLYCPGFDPDAAVDGFRAISDAEARPLYVLGGSGMDLCEVMTPPELRRFEHLVTQGTSETGMVVVCLYDRRLQSAGSMEAAQATHPLTSDDGGPIKRNERFAYVGV